MKTFHLGGVTGEDITSGLPRVEEIFEGRRPKYEAPISEIAGIAKIHRSPDKAVMEIISDEPMVEEIKVPEGYEIAVSDGEQVKAKKAVAVAQNRKAIRTNINGVAKVEKGKVIVRSKDKISVSYETSGVMRLLIKDGEKVEKGKVLTEGHLNLSSSLKLQGKEEVIKYIIKETKAIYSSQGQSINDKHLEVIIRQMLSKLRVIEEGDSSFVPGQIADKLEYEKEVKRIGKGELPVVEPIVMGITRVALKTDSFLAAASFQETTSVLINAAISGATDGLRGLKENVIIGKLIPAGTGFKK
jgi:DNA-directed RNA polymerase subunit beta'